MKKLKKDLKQDERFTSIFFIQAVNGGLSKENKPNLKFSLADKSGKISGYLWDNLSEAMDTVKEGTFAVVEGTPRVKEGTLFIKISRIRVAEDSEIDYTDFGSSTPKGIGNLIRKLDDLVESIGDEDCWRLIKSFTEDKSFMRNFGIAPAGKSIHHGYIGGLLEHTTGVMEKASWFTDGSVDRDIIMTASFLHDIGKTRELRVLPKPDYTDEGSLLGHIILGCLMTDKAMASLEDFPDNLRLLLLHMVASHHGNREWGSPVPPSTPAAILLPYLDGMDARMNHAEGEVEKIHAFNFWSVYDRILKARIYGKPYISRSRRENRRLAA